MVHPTHLHLIDELNDALDCLDRKKYPHTAISLVIDKEEIFYVRRVFNHDYYHSLIFSGRLDEIIPSSLIQPLQDIFSTIKGHNGYLGRVLNIEDNNVGIDNHPATIQYLKWMDKHEQILLKEIPPMIKKLQA